MSKSRFSLSKTGTIVLITTLYLFCYINGLFGSFLLDDFGNLDKLGDYNGVRNLDTFIKYLASGIAGPTGRPISLLSFLLNGSNWPTDPFPFKLTNVLLHGISGIFLYLLCRRLLCCFYTSEDKIHWVALFATAAWLLHPFFVSTVLYVVQRMAMLSAFFSIIGLWLYAKGRHLISGQPRRAYRYMSGAVVLCTLLAIFSKENGVLLPLLIACVEFCVFSHRDSRVAPLNKLWQVLFLTLPSLAIFAYLFSEINPYTFDHPFANRAFTLPQRLMTESRLVVEYLYYLLIPRMSYPGVLNENILISTGLWAPPTTLFSVVTLTTLFIFGIFARQRWPFVSLAILFFLAGHVLESTSLGLELYFEHRNYLPAIFLFLPFATATIEHKQKSIRAGLILFLVICALFTYQYSKLWGNPLQLSLFWAEKNHHSARAQRTAALELENAGKPLAALTLLTRGKANIPDSLDLKWHWFILKCRYGGVSSGDIEEIDQATKGLSYTSHAFNMLQGTVQTMLSPDCKGVNSQDALGLLDNLISNPSVQSNPRVIFQMHHLKGIVYAEEQKPEQAFGEFEKVLSLQQNIEHGLVQVSILASHGYFAHALSHLQHIEPLAQKMQSNALSANSKPDYKTEINRIKQNLQEELAKQ